MYWRNCWYKCEDFFVAIFSGILIKEYWEDACIAFTFARTNQTVAELSR